jgi:hypothetical protein
MKMFRYIKVLALSALAVSCIPTPPPTGVPNPCRVQLLAPVSDPFAMPQPGMSMKDATHQYTRFHIYSNREYKNLEAAGIPLLDHPVEALPGEDGTYATEHTALYSVFYGAVPKSFNLSAYRAEKIRDLYMPVGSELSKIQGVEKQFNGRVTFFDPVDSTMKPLEGVQVQIKSGTMIVSTHSDASGDFSIITTAITRDTVEVLLRFENDELEIHTLSLNDILGVRGVNVYSLGFRQACAFDDLQLVVDKTVNSAGLHHSCAMLLSFNKYKDFASAFGYQMPDKKFLIWLGREAPISVSYAAPMLQNMSQQNIGNPVQLLMNLFGFPEDLAISMSNTLKNELPDIYAPFYNRYNRYARASFIETMFHEFSHSSHYAKVGPDFWLPYVEYIYGNGGYGGDSLPNSGIISMSESWAEDLSNIGLNFIYGKPSYITLNENTGVNWIPYGLYHDIYDTGANENFDAVSGIGFPEIYNQFTADTRSPEAIREKLKAAYPAQSAAIDNLFSRYGY